jgi:hypothetical protein
MNYRSHGVRGTLVEALSAAEIWKCLLEFGCGSEDVTEGNRSQDRQIACNVEEQRECHVRPSFSRYRFALQ